MSTWTPIILALLALLGGGGGVYSALTVGATRRKMVAEAAQVQANTTTVLGGFAVDVLLKPLRERIAELEVEVDELRGRVRESFRREEEVERLRIKLDESELENARLRGVVATLHAATDAGCAGHPAPDSP